MVTISLVFVAVVWAIYLPLILIRHNEIRQVLREIRENTKRIRDLYNANKSQKECTCADSFMQSHSD